MSARKSDPAGGGADFAAVLTWFVPGAGHVYLGRPLFGIVAFVLVEGLYYLGVHLSDGRLFEFLEPDLQGPFAGALAPEVGNLGALVWHMRSYGFGPGFPRSWPEHIHLGVWLTAASGILNACLMVSANLAGRRDARVAARSPRATLPVVAGWLVPGLGHVLQKRVARGIAVFVLLVGLFVLGTWLAEGSNLDRERHFYYWGGQALLGAPAMLLEALHGHARVTHDIPYVDAGLVMVCLAGLLNVLALLDVFARAETEPAPARVNDADPLVGDARAQA
jgi:TM2 domain-containing membrane protein YozV